MRFVRQDSKEDKAVREIKVRIWDGEKNEGR